MSAPQSPPRFLDVPTLLASRQQWAGVRLWQLLGVFALIVMISIYFSTRGEGSAQIVNIISVLAMILLVGVLIFVMWLTVRRARAEEMLLQGVEELVRLRRWPEAAGSIQQMLTQPIRLPHVRIQALIYLTSVLMRYNRFEDAVLVQNYILENVHLDAGTLHGLRLARAMALLRQDHLFDADQAINELRNQVSRAGRALEQRKDSSGETESPQSLSAGLALVEMYRDVKTGHPAEAIETFNQTLSSLRDQLGQRVGDAYALAARAYDMLNRSAEAQENYQKATLLVLPIELHRRYPETETLSNKYLAPATPREAA